MKNDMKREKLLCLALYLQEALESGILKIKNKIIKITDFLILYGEKKTKLIIYDEQESITFYINKEDEKYILDSNYNILSFINDKDEIIVFIKN